jgi:hypothetical protein
MNTGEFEILTTIMNNTKGTVSHLFDLRADIIKMNHLLQ